MTIGINAVAAFKQPRTGVEEYTYQLIRYLTMLEESRKHRFILYSHLSSAASVLSWPDNFQVSQLKWPGPLWTQIRLALEMAVHRPEVLFIPVHILPLVHPDNSVVTIHGLEYEYYPQMYPWRHLKYLRWSTKYALKKARRIITVSESTKKDLLKLYGGQPERIKVVYHGIDMPHFQSVGPKNKKPYILFLGRLETKKNVFGLIEAFNLLKNKYQVPHQLILVGPRGYGYQPVERDDIIEKGYIGEQEKWQLLQGAAVFVLPSFYEGFGLPILEAQAAGCPVVTSDLSAMPEVAGQAALLINPNNVEQIAEAVYKIINDNRLRKYLIDKGYANLKRFSWSKCAQQTLETLTE